MTVSARLIRMIFPKLVGNKQSVIFLLTGLVFPHLTCVNMSCEHYSYTARINKLHCSLVARIPLAAQILDTSLNAVISSNSLS